MPYHDKVGASSIQNERIIHTVFTSVLSVCQIIFVSGSWLLQLFNDIYQGLTYKKNWLTYKICVYQNRSYRTRKCCQNPFVWLTVLLVSCLQTMEQLCRALFLYVSVCYLPKMLLAISVWISDMRSYHNVILIHVIYANVNHTGPRLNIKTVLSTYGDFHVKDKTAVRTSYL